MSALDDKPFPKAPLAGALFLVAASLLVVGGSRMGMFGSPAAQADASVTVTPAVSQDLRFIDRADGAVIVKAVGGPDQLIESNSGGFVRGVVRGLVRDRRARGIGPEPVFRLTEWSDGRLTIEDTATRRSLNLNAFGPTNRAAFQDILRAAGAGA